MSRFIQLHILTSYPASNLNRDDLGRPKTVMMGNAQRLRVSSQSLKRAWRTSDVFVDSLGGNVGVRTKEIGKYAYRALVHGASFEEVMDDFDAKGSLATVKDKNAVEIGRAIGNVFAKIKKAVSGGKDDNDAATVRAKMESLETEQMAHLSPVELKNVSNLVEICRETGKGPEAEQLDLLRKDGAAVDIALFGRMLASSNRYNIEASAQVAHAMTVHSATVEDDFFTAVDDLNKDDSGAGHLGVSEFGAGLFYLYLCIDRELLIENLDGNTELADKALEALVTSVCTVSPTGKQNSFASRAWASYCLAEKGDMQPRSLAEAFLSPLTGSECLLEKAIEKIEVQRDKFNSIYGATIESKSFGKGDGTLAGICDFITE